MSVADAARGLRRSRVHLVDRLKCGRRVQRRGLLQPDLALVGAARRPRRGAVGQRARRTSRQCPRRTSRHFERPQPRVAHLQRLRPAAAGTASFCVRLDGAQRRRAAPRRSCRPPAPVMTRQPAAVAVEAATLRPEAAWRTPAHAAVDTLMRQHERAASSQLRFWPRSASPRPVVGAEVVRGAVEGRSAGGVAYVAAPRSNTRVRRYGERAQPARGDPARHQPEHVKNGEPPRTQRVYQTSPA